MEISHAPSAAHSLLHGCGSLHLDSKTLNMHCNIVRLTRRGDQRLLDHVSGPGNKVSYIADTKWDMIYLGKRVCHASHR